MFCSSSYRKLCSIRRRQIKGEREPSSDVIGPLRAPRGLLFYYILTRVAVRPIYGYQILQDIEDNTERVWRPGPGSIHPNLKKMLSRGYIKAKSVKKVEAGQRFHQITAKGIKHLQETKDMFVHVGQRWSFMCRIFANMIEPEHVSTFLLDGSRTQFQIIQGILKSTMNLPPQDNVEYLLKEYALNLERQLGLTDNMFNGLEKKPARIRA